MGQNDHKGIFPIEGLFLHCEREENGKLSDSYQRGQYNRIESIQIANYERVIDIEIYYIKKIKPDSTTTRQLSTTTRFLMKFFFYFF